MSMTETRPNRRAGELRAGKHPLSQRRVEAGLSQHALRKASGVNAAYISAAENISRPLTEEELAALADVEPSEV